MHNFPPENDIKLNAMFDLLQDLRHSPYPPELIKKTLTSIEKTAIKYLLDDLPEGQSYHFYTEKLDNFVTNIIKKELK